MDRNTPNYIVEEKSSYETLSTTALKRAFSFKEKAKKSGKKLVVEYTTEIERERIEELKNKWKEKREYILERYGFDRYERDKIREEAENNTKGVRSWRK